MFGTIFKFFRELDRRVKVLYAFIGLHSWDQELSMQYNQLYATMLGANPVELGTLNGIRRVASSMISIPSGWFADKYDLKKILLIGLSCMVVIAAIYSMAVNWVMLIPAILLSGAGMRLVLPIADVFLSNLAKPEQRAMVISISRTLWAMLRISAPIVATIIVAHFGGLTTEGIRPLYYIQLGVATLVFFSIAIWLKTPRVNPIERSISNIHNGSGFIQDLRDLFQGERWLKRWLLIFATRNIAMALSGPFIPLWLVENGVDEYVLGAMAVAGIITFILFQIPAGMVAERFGRKKAYYLFRPFTHLATVLLILVPGSEYLILVGILGGTASTGQEGLGGVSFSPFVTMNFELVPAEKRGRWVGFLGVTTILSFPASMLGGIMWQQGLKMAVLLIPVLLEFLIIIPLMSTIPDTLRRTKI